MSHWPLSNTECNPCAVQARSTDPSRTDGPVLTVRGLPNSPAWRGSDGGDQALGPSTSASGPRWSVPARARVRKALGERMRTGEASATTKRSSSPVTRISVPAEIASAKTRSSSGSRREIGETTLLLGTISHCPRTAAAAARATWLAFSFRVKTRRTSSATTSGTRSSCSDKTSFRRSAQRPRATKAATRTLESKQIRVTRPA